MQFFLDTKGFQKTNATDKALDVIELSFGVIDTTTRSFGYLHRQNADEIATAAIEELNARFKEHGIGYSYSDGTIWPAPGSVDTRLS